MERLRASHEAAVEMKAHLAATVAAGSDLKAIFQVFPPWLVMIVRRYINSKKGALGLFGNVLISNVPGPRDPIYFNKYKLDSWFSTGQVFDGSCVNMTMWSYCGRANLCILADQRIIPDGWIVYNYFIEELQALIAQIPMQQADEENKHE